MHTLFVAATLLEAEWLIAKLRLLPVQPGLLWRGLHRGTDVGVLVTVLRPQRAVNIGVAGAFSNDLVLEQVVLVQHDTYADLGAETADGGFQPMLELGFAVLAVGEHAFGNTLAATVALQVPHVPVHGLTVNTITGTAATRQQLVHRWPAAQIETMEGAAFFHSCTALGVLAAQLRAISNYVGPRNTA
jgi:futalosine hydrolase